jgi:ATP-dependent Clp protease ATP-binding subunit ClpA
MKDIMKSKTIRLFKNIFNSDETDLEVEDNTSNKSKSSTVSSNQQKKEERKLTVDFFGTDLTDEARNSHIDPVI